MTNTIISILLIISAVYGYRKEIAQSDKRKKFFNLVLLVLSIWLIVMNLFLQYQQTTESEEVNRKLGRSFDSILAINKGTKDNLVIISKQNDSIRNQNILISRQSDSMLIVAAILKSEIKESRKALTKLEISTLLGLDKNANSIDRIGKISTGHYITESEKIKMVNLLKQEPGKICFELVNEDPECTKFIVQLRQIFREAKWSTNNQFNYMKYALPVQGMHIIVKDSKTLPVGINKVIDISNQLGIKYELNEDNADDRQKDWVYIQIGSLR